MGRDESTLPATVALEAALKRIEIHQLIKLLIEKDAITQADGVAFFVRMAEAAGSLAVTPKMKASAAIAIRHYDDLASMIGRRDTAN